MTDPNNGTVMFLPQLVMDLCVEVGKGSCKLLINCGKVTSCKFCKDAVTYKETIRVTTTEHPDEFDVVLAPNPNPA